MPSGGDFRFGPYRLDLRARRLLRDRDPVPLQPLQFQLLHLLVSRAGEVLTSQRLMDDVWKDLSVEPNSLTKAVSQLRSLLDNDNPTRYIETTHRVGYRFVAPVSRGEAPATDADIDAMLAPHRAALEGRAALESLQVARAAAAESTYQELLARRADDPRAHAGLAAACLARYEATRADARPDLDALGRAETYAREAIRLKLDYAEAWLALAAILDRRGDHAGAIAACRQAIELEPDEWPHYLRLGMMAWGRDRLDAARHLVGLMPGLPAAHWLTATVHVGRNALADAKRALDPGIAAIARATDETTAFPPIALYWLDGMLALASGDDEAALASFARERAMDANGHIYGRETEANTCYAIGGCEHRRGNTSAARDAFGEALVLIPGHKQAHAGLALVDPSSRPAVNTQDASSVDSAMAAGVILVARREAPAAARLVAAALRAAPPGNAGWTIPIDPLLGVQRDLDTWMEVLAILRGRAR